MSLNIEKMKFAKEFVKSRDAKKALAKSGVEVMPGKEQETLREFLRDEEVQILVGITMAHRERGQPVTVESITNDLNEAMVYAKVYKNVGALVSAVKVKAQVNKLIIEQQQVSGSVDHRHRRVDDGDLEDRIRRIEDKRLDYALQ